MKFMAATCPSCGGALQVTTDLESAWCMYCGKTIIIERAVRAAAEANITNWMALAAAAAESGNSQEAYDYYTRVLEYNGKNVDAWVGKGEAAGQLSTLVNFRLSEMRTAFQNAIKNSEQSERTKSIAQDAAIEINNVALSLFNMSTLHLKENISLDTSFGEYTIRCAQILDALEYAQSLSPSDPEYIENAIFVCTDVLRGRSFDDKANLDSSGKPTSRAWNLFPSFREGWQQRDDRYVEKLRQINPSYSPPKVQEAKPVGGGCFIATATMGRFDDDIVVVLREFRDEVLGRSRIGRRFVDHYYLTSPKYAEFIRPRPASRAIAFVCLVWPASVIARIVLKLTR